MKRKDLLSLKDDDVVKYGKWHFRRTGENSLGEPIFTCTSDPSFVLREGIFYAHMMEYVPDYEDMVEADKAKKAAQEKIDKAAKALKAATEAGTVEVFDTACEIEFEQNRPKRKIRKKKTP